MVRHRCTEVRWLQTQLNRPMVSGDDDSVSLACRAPPSCDCVRLWAPAAATAWQTREAPSVALHHSAPPALTRLFAVLLPPVPQEAGSKFAGLPFCNYTLSIEVRAADAVARLTTAEKINALGTNTGQLPSLGLNAYNWWSEATHGISHVRDGQCASRVPLAHCAPC